MVKIFWLGEVVYPRTISPEPIYYYFYVVNTNNSAALFTNKRTWIYTNLLM